ncbi:MAG: pyridoxal phosphate-dependent aminotransferase [Candidatus Limivicinus sp.]|jgi:threonine-phosphate decarboxylase
MLYYTENPHGGDVYGGDIELDFSANVNPFGTPEAVQEAVRNELPNMWRYPDPYCRRLVKAIAAREAVPENYILCGNGAAELIYSFCLAVKPGLASELVPTFSEYALGLKRCGSRIERFFLREENSFRADEKILNFIREKRPEVFFICNPNNPSGLCMEPSLLKKVLGLSRETGTRIFLDECFMDLADRDLSMKGFLSEYPGLIILKAFTKSYGMAGIRLGYCLSSDSWLLSRMAETVQPWNVSAPAQAAGEAALRENEFLDRFRAMIPSEREFLRRGMEELGFKVCPSEVNFLLFRAPENLGAELRKKGIAIRDCGDSIGLQKGWFRIAVRRREENGRLISAMREICRDR